MESHIHVTAEAAASSDRDNNGAPPENLNLPRSFVPSPMNLEASENHMVEDEEMVKFTVQKSLEAMKMEDETMAEGKAPFSKLTREQREKAVRTPPLPSAWAVQSLLTQPLSVAEKEMPAIDENRVDAIGTLNKPPTLEVEFNSARNSSPVNIAPEALPWGAQIPPLPSALGNNDQLGRFRIPSPLPILPPARRASSFTPVTLPPRPRTVSPTPIGLGNEESSDVPSIFSNSIPRPGTLSPTSSFRPIHKPQARRSTVDAPGQDAPTSSRKRPYNLSLSEPPAARLRVIGDETSDTIARKKKTKRCNCKNSKCLKLYCECFASRSYCQDCNCTGCCNTPENEEKVRKAVTVTLERNPTAFRAKITAGPRGPGKDSVEPAIGKHNKGCHCRKSNCLKKYCECFQANILCGDNCKCSDCKNYDDSLERRAILEGRRTPPAARRRRISKSEPSFESESRPERSQSPCQPDYVRSESPHASEIPMQTTSPLPLMQPELDPHRAISPLRPTAERAPSPFLDTLPSAVRAPSPVYIENLSSAAFRPSPHSAFNSPLGGVPPASPFGGQKLNVFHNSSAFKPIDK